MARDTHCTFHLGVTYPSYVIVSFISLSTPSLPKNEIHRLYLPGISSSAAPSTR